MRTSKSTWSNYLLLSLLLFALSFFTFSPASAVTVVPPSDLGVLARRVEAVVLAQAQGTTVRPGGLGLVTLTQFLLRERVGGRDPGASFLVSQPGGVLGEVGLAVSGAPRFARGRVYLLFLSRQGDDLWTTPYAAWGVLVEEGEKLKWVPEAIEVALVGPTKDQPGAMYEKARLVSELRRAALGLPYDLAAAQAPAPAPEIPANCVRLTANDGFPVRWFGFETGSRIGVWATTPGQTGLGDGGQGAVANGSAAWRTYGAAVLNLDYSGLKARSLDCNQGNRGGEVWFDDPCSAIPDLVGCSGTLAWGGTWFSSGTQTYDGSSWHPALNQGSYGPFVVVNNGAQCVGTSNFQEMMTHELGHALGFGHHTDSAAVMYAMCCRGGGAQIYTTDKVCASDQYHTFLDVPYAFWAWSYVEGVDDAGVTTGCGGGNFCPASTVTRAQMAVFLLKAKYGSSYSPPSCSGLFADVPCPGYWAANWIEALANEGITSGCGGANYCPEANISRAQMAVFLLKAKNGSSYVPPACSGLFADVPCPGHWAANWIEALANAGVTSGCGGGDFCPAQSVSRAQMAVFLVKNFGLPHP